MRERVRDTGSDDVDMYVEKPVWTVIIFTERATSREHFRKVGRRRRVGEELGRDVMPFNVKDLSIMSCHEDLVDPWK